MPFSSLHNGEDEEVGFISKQRWVVIACLILLHGLMVAGEVVLEAAAASIDGQTDQLKDQPENQLTVQLTELLTSGDPEQQLAGLQQVQEQKIHTALSTVIHLLGSLDTGVRQAAGDVLAGFGADSLSLIHEALQDRVDFSELVRLELVRLCGEIGGEQAVSVLTGALSDPDVAVRRGIILTLEKIGFDKAQVLEAISGGIQDPNQQIRQAAVNALQRVPTQLLLQSPASIAALLQARSDSNTNVAVAAAVTIRRLGADFTDVLGNMLADPNYALHQREVVAQELIQIAPEEGAAALWDLLLDQDADLKGREVAAKVLLAVDDAQVKDILVAFLHDPEQALELRTLAARLIFQFDSTALISLIVEFSSEGNWDQGKVEAFFAALTAQMLAEYDPQVAEILHSIELETDLATVLKEVLASKHLEDRVRQRAAGYLRQIYPEVAAHLYKEMLDDAAEPLDMRRFAAIELGHLLDAGLESSLHQGSLASLQKALEADSIELRLTAASILRQKSDVVVLPKLIQIVPDAQFTQTSRGYLTTPEELRIIADKAEAGIEPYRSNVAEFLRFIGPPDYWPYGEISGEINVYEGSSDDPPHLSASAAKLVYGKAIAYHVTGDHRYADSAREHILDLTDTYGFGGNQSILNLARGGTPYIYAADLLEPYANWSKEDKLHFQAWLRDQMYPKVAWASRVRKNNWGVAGSFSAAVIADYLWDTGWTLMETTPKQLTLSLAEAYHQHNLQQVRRQSPDNQWKMDAKTFVWGILPHGGIPEEIRRGSNAVDGLYLERIDSGGQYTMTYVEHLTAHAEFLLRRGDPLLYNLVFPDGSGSLLKAIRFVIDNPIKSHPWESSRRGALHIAYMYYRDPSIARSLKQSGRGTIDGQRLSLFGRLTHQFAEDESPGMPPLTEPPR